VELSLKNEGFVNLGNVWVLAVCLMVKFTVNFKEIFWAKDCYYLNGNDLSSGLIKRFKSL